MKKSSMVMKAAKGFSMMALGLLMPGTILDADGANQTTIVIEPEVTTTNDQGGGQGVPLGLLYGDQWIIVRDVTEEGNGKPIYFTWEWPDNAYDEDGNFIPTPGTMPTGYQAGVENGCVQPVSFEPVALLGEEQFKLPNPEDPENRIYYYDSYGRKRIPTYLIPLDPECKIPDIYADSWGTQVIETDSGRFNLARSPQSVLNAAYEEVISVFNRAQAFSLDPAGRIVVKLPLTDDPGETQIYGKTIDSPLENLALYQKVMQNGCLPATENIFLTGATVALMANSPIWHLVCSDDTETTEEDFLRAASFMAGAGDKSGRIDVDILIYLNNRLDVNDVEWIPCDKVVSIGYRNFYGTSYNRGNNYSSTTADLLQPPNEEDSTYPASFTVVKSVPLYEKIFSDEWPNSPEHIVDMDTPIIRFVRAADDALAIINYLHNYKLPVHPLSPVAEPTYPTE